MENPRIVRLVRKAIALSCERDPQPLGLDGVVPVSHYLAAERLERERERLFRRLPIPLAATAELAEPGATLVRELDGVSLLLLRDQEGVARAFKNACRHRGTRLLQKDCSAKALVCPYHGWTYGLDGRLRHIPHAQAFPAVDAATHRLAPVRLEERHGLLWVALEPSAPDVAEHLGELDAELATLSLHTHVPGRRVRTEQRGNWKMLMEAFLESYHVRTLHRNTVYQFFMDSRVAAERIGLHALHATARRTATEVASDPELGGVPLRELATCAYLLFPCTVIIFHPTWTSHVIVLPLAPDRFVWNHTQLIPSLPDSDKARAHFERSFELVDGQVFQGEDLRNIAEIQAGLETGANDVVTFGQLEAPALWLHEGIRQLLGD